MSNSNGWKRNLSGNFELIPAGGIIHVVDDEDQLIGDRSLYVEHPGMEPAGHSNQEYLNPIESQTNHHDEELGTQIPPSIVGYINLDGPDGKPNGRQIKFSQWLYESGQKLLTDMIDKAGQGIAQEKYCTSAHQEYLNTMFPQTRNFLPDRLSKRIVSYVSYCKKFVNMKYMSGQGEQGASMVNQSLSQEEEIVNLLKAAQSECKATPPPKIYHGASTRYTASSDKVANPESLEDEVSCLSCNKTEQDFVSTEFGQLCMGCYQIQMSGKDDLSGRNGAQKRQDEARMRQNEAMLNMPMSGENSKGKNAEENAKGTSRKRVATTSTLSKDEERDNKLNDMLMEHLEGAQQTKALEDEKKALEIKKLRLEIQKLEQN